jgi:hypothetical protein
LFEDVGGYGHAGMIALRGGLVAWNGAVGSVCWEIRMLGWTAENPVLGSVKGVLGRFGFSLLVVGPGCPVRAMRARRGDWIDGVWKHGRM